MPWKLAKVPESKDEVSLFIIAENWRIINHHFLVNIYIALTIMCIDVSKSTRAPIIKTDPFFTEAVSKDTMFSLRHHIHVLSFLVSRARLKGVQLMVDCRHIALRVVLPGSTKLVITIVTVFCCFWKIIVTWSDNVSLGYFSWFIEIIWTFEFNYFIKKIVRVHLIYLLH